MDIEFGQRLKHARDRVIKPTDQQIVERFQKRGIDTIVSVPCSITQTIDAQWQDMADNGQMRLIRAVSENALIGVASGAWLGNGEIAMAHMQNSGFTNSADGLISFARVYGIPVLELVTWRGSNKADDSEPHQAIGERTQGLTREIAGSKNMFGDRLGRGILRAMDKAIDQAQAGGVAIIRLSPDAFKKTYPMHTPDIESEDQDQYEERSEKIKREKGSSRRDVIKRPRISRAEAMQEIVGNHPDAAIIFSNGYNARGAQAHADRLGNFYNAGYMGGASAIAMGLALVNPDIEVVWVDGDQNAQMGWVKDNLAAKYPRNLHGYVLDNGIGASVGVSRSLALAPWHYDLTRVIRTVPDGRPGEFTDKRVGAHGVYFKEEEARDLASKIGPLPAHTLRFRHWVDQQTNKNRTDRIEREFSDLIRGASFHTPY